MAAASTHKQLEPDTRSVEERIRTRAYELFVQRGNASGSELDDWLQAEEEILAAQDRHIEEGE
jgi:hypothetical protein